MRGLLVCASFLAFAFTAQAQDDQGQRLEQAIAWAERVCFVGDVAKLEGDPQGNLIIRRMLYEFIIDLKEYVKLNYADPKISHLLQDKQVQEYVQGKTRECMRSGWSELFVSSIPNLPLQTPSVKMYRQKPFKTLREDGTPSGTMSGIHLTITEIVSTQPKVRYAAEWTWSGRGGFRNGSYIVSVTIKGSDNSTLKILPSELDTNHCYYDGHQQSVEGDLDIDFSEVVDAVIEVSTAKGTVNPC